MNRVVGEYAIALFEVMLEQEDREKIWNDLNVVRDVISDNPEYIEFLMNPSITRAERQQSLQDVFEGSVCETVFSFLNVMLDHRDIYQLVDVYREFGKLYEDYMNIADAAVISAVELTKQQKEKLELKLNEVTGKTVRAEYTIDKSIIGGLLVTVDGKRFDGSVRSNLKNLKEVIS